MRTGLIGSMMVVAAAGAFCFAFAQPEKRTPEQEAEMMKRMNAPRPEHQWLADTAGNFKITMKVFGEQGGAPLLVMEADSVREVILGGKFLVDRVVSTDAKAAFSTMSIYGFNPDGRAGPRFEIVRYSSMVTCAMPEVGKWDPVNKLLTSEGEHEVNGMVGHIRVIQKHEGADKFTAEAFLSFEGYSEELKGVKVAEYKAMEMEYRRVDK